MEKMEQDIGLKFLENQEMERQRIARELHDSTVQNLTMLIHKAELCFKLIEKDPVQAQLEIRIMSEALRSTINEMRDIIYDLRPMALDDLGLKEALERYVAQAMLQHEIMLRLSVSGNSCELPPIVSTTLFRIITEACNNAIKHGKPGKIDISLNYGGDYLECSVEDDGIGFEVKENAGMKNFGLSIMKERTHLLKGDFLIRSEIGKGTKIRVKIPVL